MATGDVWDREVMPGEELALDSPGCGWESRLCHSLVVTFPELLSVSEPFPQVQNGAGAPLHTRGSEVRPADVMGVHTPSPGQRRSPQTELQPGVSPAYCL